MSGIHAALLGGVNTAGLFPWSIGRFRYLGNSFSVSAQAKAPRAMFVRSDGLKLYIANDTGDLYQYTLSAAWDITTASYDSKTFDVGVAGAPRGLSFKPDGTVMFVLTETSSDRVTSYNLSTAWDISTATSDTSFSVFSQTANPEGLFFRDDGLRFYVTDNDLNRVLEYKIIVAWDLDTALYQNDDISVSAQTTSLAGVFFKDDGERMYVVGLNPDIGVYQYSLSTAWQVDTASYDGVFLETETQDNQPSDLFFKPDGERLFVIGSENDSVYEYGVE